MAKAQVQLQKRVEKKEVEYPTVAQVVREVTKPIVTPDLRENDRVVLDALIGVHHATRSNLVQLCELPRTTIYDALVRLERLGIVEHYFEERKTRGRPKTLFRAT